MYLPKHFSATDAEVRGLLAGIQAADLITPTQDGLYATFLPLIYDERSNTLKGHVARKNEHWKLAPSGESLVIAHGPDGYITPSWYETKRETGKVVPTWNYLTAHIHGELVIHDDVTWLEQLVTELTNRHESDRAAPWAVDDAPRDFIEGQLRAIVGVELKVTRIEAKAKLGQNRQPADIDGVVAGLAQRGRPRDRELADSTQRSRRR